MELEKLKERYPDLSLLDLYYFSMKYHGVRDKDKNRGRPTWNLIDDNSLYHITFATSEPYSPFCIEDQRLSLSKKSIPFRVDFVERVAVTIGRYFYFRNSDYMTPTLDDELILNINLQRQCFACKFCQFILYKTQPDISEDEGFKLIDLSLKGNNLENVSEIAIVTGLFGSSEKVADHIIKIINLAVERGFKGRIFYIGFELTNPKNIKKILLNIEQNNLKGFKIAYTFEMFNKRNYLMHHIKSKYYFSDIVSILKLLKDCGVISLEYTYIPALDNLDDFKFGAEKLAPLAEPHISIFRPWYNGQRFKQISYDFIKEGPEYLCKMRLFYEELYGKKFYGNNLGNLWSFPLNKISKKWIEEVIIGQVDGRRYWINRTNPRKNLIQSIY